MSTNANQPRQPKGVPTGGQWKAISRPEGTTSLVEVTWVREAQKLTPAQLDEIAEIAYEHEPDWDEVYETGWHDWCGQTSRAVCTYLESEGIEAQVVDGGFCGNAHAWVELSDGTIVDPTIRQYVDRTDEHIVDEQAVPWAQATDGECLVAVIPPGHPLGQNYVQ